MTYNEDFYYTDFHCFNVPPIQCPPDPDEMDAYAELKLEQDLENAQEVLQEMKLARGEVEE